ncbi:hypothetical protein [Komagataeibacter intermedius]|uniref:hypothetical protein n=1 Tax=Komagataeibacter intermedius TaxID=66229 RepID=UPI003B42A679
MKRLIATLYSLTPSQGTPTRQAAREDRVPAVPMTRQPRPGAIRRLLPVMVALVLPLGACARGKFGEDFCISCASEKQAASTGPAAGTPATGAAARPPGAPTSTQATSGTRHL